MRVRIRIPSIGYKSLWNFALEGGLRGRLQKCLKSCDCSFMYTRNFFFLIGLVSSVGSGANSASGVTFIVDPDPE
jgi:hypothetical protein